MSIPDLPVEVEGIQEAARILGLYGGVPYNWRVLQALLDGKDEDCHNAIYGKTKVSVYSSPWERLQLEKLGGDRWRISFIPSGRASRLGA